MFGSDGKCYFPENSFLLTEIFPFDPKMILHSYFHFKSFPGSRETQRAREKRQNTTQRERELESPDRRERERESPDRRAPIVNRAARRTIAPISPPLNVAFTVWSHLLLRRAISIWLDLMNFFAGFCFFCEWVWNWFIFFCWVLFLLPDLMHFL